MSDHQKIELRREQIELGERLYYCSNSGEGRKMRRFIEKRIRQIDRLLNVSE